jgi:hypothetical protein
MMPFADRADRVEGRIGRKTCHRPTPAAHHRPTRRLWSARTSPRCIVRRPRRAARSMFRLSSPGRIPLVAEKHNGIHRIGIQRPEPITTEWHRVASPAHSVFRKQKTMEQYIDEFATAAGGDQHLLVGAAGSICSSAVGRSPCVTRPRSHCAVPTPAATGQRQPGSGNRAAATTATDRSRHAIHQAKCG